jgi:hypothetical protein
LRRLAVLICAVSLGGLGCGGDSDEEQATAAAEEWAASVSSGDFDGACEQMTTTAQEVIGGTEPGECYHALQDALQPTSTPTVDYSVDEVSMDSDGQGAEATLSGEGVGAGLVPDLILSKEGDEWMISALGL